jgi:hypothetical protein
VRISETLLVQQVDEQIVIMDESSGQEAIVQGRDLATFTRKAQEEAVRGVDVIEVDGLLIHRSAFQNLFVALTYFTGTLTGDTGHFTEADSE